VTDKDGGIGVATPQTTIVGNVAPTAAINGAPANSPEGTAINLTCTVSDPGTLDTFTYAWSVVAGNGQVISPDNGTSFAFTPNDAGTYTVNLQVRDDDGGIGNAAPVVITVTNVAQTVAITGAPAYSLEGMPINLGMTLSDPGLDTFTYLWTVAASNGQVTPNGSAATFSFTPNDNGTYTATLTATDTDGAAQGSDTKVIHVTNVAPTAAITASPGPYLEGTAITVTGTATDPSAVDSFACSWRVTKNGMDYTSVSHGPGLSIPDTFTFTPDQQGNYVVALTITDKDGGSGVAPSQPISVTNVVPTVTINGAPATSQEGTPIHLTSTVLDPGIGDTFTYAWNVTASNGQVLPVGTGSTFTFTPVHGGSYVVSLSVTDRDGAVGVAPAQTIDVRYVVPKVTITGAPTTSPKNTAIGLNSVIHDPGQHTFTYAWNVTVDGFQYATGTAPSFMFAPDATGAYVVSLTATDDEGGVNDAADETIIVTNVVLVAAIADAPTNSLEGTPITLGVSVIDPGVHTFTYLWTATSSNGQTIPNGLGGTFSFTPNAQGNYAVSVTVTDDDGSVGVAPTIKVNVINVTPAAVITLPPAPYLEGTAIMVTGTATDPGSVDTFSYSWLVTKDGMDYSTATHGPGLGTSNTFTFMPGISGSYRISLTVTDKDGDVGVAPSQIIAVTSVPPAVTIDGAPASSPEGTAINLTSTVTSPGAANTFTYAWSVTKNGAPYATGADPSFAFTPDHSGSYVVSLTVTASGGGATTVSQPIPVTSVPPVFSSGLSADINPTLPMQVVHFTCAATDVDPLTWRWDFGDGTSDTAGGCSVSHAFSPAGAYTVTVTATNPSGQSTSESLAMQINAASVGAEVDSDGDGVPDAIELALGSDPLQASSTPLAASPAVVQTLAVKKMGAKLNFARQGRDSMTLTGMLPVPAGFSPAGQKILLDIGGIIRVFTLNKNGAAKSGKDQFRMRIKRSRGSVPVQMSPFTLKLPRGSFASSLADDGLVQSPTSNSQRVVNVTVVMNQTMYQKAVNLVYNNRFGKAGTANGVINAYTR
jgi:PKD repeat protein